MRSCGVHCSKLFTLESGPFLNGIQFSYCSSSRIYWECPTLIHRIIINRNQIGRGRHVRWDTCDYVSDKTGCFQSEFNGRNTVRDGFRLREKAFSQSQFQAAGKR